MTENDPLRRMYIESALNRAQNLMDPEAAQAVAAGEDWWTVCQVCGKRREGTLDQLVKPCDHGQTS